MFKTFLDILVKFPLQLKTADKIFMYWDKGFLTFRQLGYFVITKFTLLKQAGIYLHSRYAETKHNPVKEAEIADN
jgi:hypothetical protein